MADFSNPSTTQLSAAEAQLASEELCSLMKAPDLTVLKYRVLVERMQGYIKEQCPCLNNALFGFIAQQKHQLAIVPGPVDDAPVETRKSFERQYGKTEYMQQPLLT